MKMTMHIDDATLAEVMKITGAVSKTAAVELALKEMVRRAKFKAIATAGLGLTKEEIKNSWEDPFPEETARLAAKKAKETRGRKRSGR